jgi:hypothetical protein
MKGGKERKEILYLVKELYCCSCRSVVAVDIDAEGNEDEDG